ncbi:hypothetical protein L1049_013416 [Liquidambar formosana]|uniref:Retrotransposon protein n=1 Tax=Liquidambar formosana TaxID=63359 RepID=A0AAP0RKQ9_LIQFO
MPTDQFREIPFIENYIQPAGDPIEYVDASDQWQTWRDAMANEMFNEWMASTSRDKDSTASTPVVRLKHQWTPLEDETLVQGLYELYTMGTWKCDTGFKSGYLLQLEKMLAQTLPGSGLKACPHIESRVKTSKRQTMAIADMFTIGSGFSWNEEDTMV